MNNQKDIIQHFGILGMHWGHRKAEPVGSGRNSTNRSTKPTKISDSQMHQTFESVRYTEFNRLAKEQGLDKRERAIIEYARKHKIDMDGGGGDRPGVGKKYTDMWDELEVTVKKNDSQAEQVATQHLLGKYGQQRYATMKRNDNIKSKALILGLMAVPLSVFAGGAYSILHTEVIK